MIDLLDDLHVVLDTCGFGSQQDFLLLLARSNLIFFDLKLIDGEAHRHYTGCDNGLILNNLQLVSESGKPFIIQSTSGARRDRYGRKPCRDCQNR